MFYNKVTHEFGLSISQVRQATGASFSDNLQEIGDYVRYSAANLPTFNAITEQAVEVAPVQVEGVWTQQWTVADLPALDRAAAAEAIDDAVAAVYGRFTRFAQEYETREQQAKDYKTAGYSGTVPRQVQAFATPAGKTASEAADIIITQAAQLRGALDDLGALRMRKYEVLGAADDATARTTQAEILAAVAAIAAAL